MSIYLGFDTSNYTTSIAAYENGNVINIRKILEVSEGKRGLRQSDALFMHIKALPKLYGSLEIDFNKVAAVGVSDKPRREEGSYMPVFLAGEGFAACCAKTLGVPLYKFSHQEGHIMAALENSGYNDFDKERFISLHLSGGTTEILLTEFTGQAFNTEIIGGTKDISAGQLVDRIGVLMGMKFPAGREMERLAASAADMVKLPVSVDGAYMNFSGTETKAASMIGKYENAAIVKGIFDAVSRTLSKTINCALKKTGCKSVLAAGGVMANAYIRHFLENNINGNVYFAKTELSSDNAVGTAILAKYAYESMV